ncbi:MAG TPA: hypothetical protein VNZ06_02850 [Steroidobacteraceae bacterium]|nr:hypothetical protein [Steroidobacteraceae bacterium]
MHITCEPAILYLGTPVVLISAVNEDGSYNLAPMSSAFWLGWRCMLGLSVFSQTTHNLMRARVLECPIQLEAIIEATHPLAQTDEKLRGRIIVFEARVQRVHIEESLLKTGEPNRIDPDRWRPLIVSFQRFYGLTARQLHESTLAKIPESAYRSPDVDQSRLATLGQLATAAPGSETFSQELIAGARHESQSFVECTS